MNKKTLISLLVAVTLLIAAIAVAIAFLYSDIGGKPDGEAIRFREAHPLVAAIPSDAALVFCVKDFDRAKAYLTDSTAVFGRLMSGQLNGLFRFSYPSLRKADAIMSLHYSKDFAPLLVVRTGSVAPADTTGDVRKLLDAADSCGLHAKAEGGNLLISTSETIIHSAVRHFSDGLSIMDADGFSELASRMDEDDILFISNAYSDNLARAFLNARLLKHSAFFERLAKWSALRVTEHTEKGVSMQGSVLDGEDPSYYLNLLRQAGPSEVRVAEVLPSQVDFVVSIPIKDIRSYIEAHRQYLDSRASLEKFKAALDEQKKNNGLHAEEWARNLDIQEIAFAQLYVAGGLRSLLLIKPGNTREALEGIREYPWKNFAKTLFGGIFTANEDSYAWIGGWMAAGEKTTVEAFLEGGFLQETLKDRLSAAGLQARIPARDCGFFLYHSLSEDPSMIDKSFTPGLASAFRKTLAGATYVPATLSVTFENGETFVNVWYDRTNVIHSKAPAADRDTTVNVPKGPFTVTNCATGKKNTFYQNSHKSLCLRDENGKDLWGIPFKEDLCGYVEEVDYYNNGKIQFLFAAGSKLYLLDRLGRFVNGFPVDLGKKIAVGPKVFDFTGAHGYSALVLHKDNSVGLYDLRGKMRKDWKGIAAKETIKAIPELLEIGKTRYWIVRTSIQTLIYPFQGGDPVVQGEGAKMIRPDSKIETDANGSIRAKSYDDKDRTYKLE